MNSSVRIEAKAHLADALRFLSTVPNNDSGRISWESNKLDRGTFEIIYSLKFTPPLDEQVKEGALWQVLNECARANDFSTRFFLRKLRGYLASHFSKEPKRLVAISQINATASSALPTVLPSAFGQVHIHGILSKTDRRVMQKHEESERVRTRLHDNFLYLVSQVTATDEHSAVDAAYRNLKFLLGVLNLITYGYGVSKRFGYPDAPIGKFLSAAPIWLVDRRSRKLGGYYFENHYPADWKQTFSVWQRTNPDTITKWAKHYLSDLSRIDFKEKMIQAIILFQEGLETLEIDVALLKFWTGIEVLCAREEREPADRTIERASSIFGDQTHAKMRLDFIQDSRNRMVHRGDVGGHALLCAQWGSIYLAALIQFCLFNRLKLRKHAQLIDYLSSPVNEARLTETISLYRKRLAVVRKRAARDGTS